MLIGVEGKDWEHLVTHTAPELAKHIAAKPRRVRSKQLPPVQGKPVPVQSGQAEPPQPSEFFQTVRRFIPGL